MTPTTPLRERKTQKVFDIFPTKRETSLVGVICRCGGLVTTKVETNDPHDRLFYCQKCNWVIEPPDGIRGYNVYYDINEIRQVNSE